MSKARDQKISENVVKEKKKRITAEKRKLDAFLKESDSERKKLAIPVVDNLAFQIVELQDLQEKIVTEGTQQWWSNGGNQGGYREATHVKTYNVTVKNFQSLMKVFMDMLPEEERADDKDDFMEFVHNKPGS